jgi:hypothetical protein
MAGYNFGLQQTAVNPYQGNNPGVVQSPFSVPASQSQTQNMIPVMPVNSKEEAYYWPLGPGNTMIFFKGDDLFVKSMGYNTAEPPKFDEYIKKVPEQKENQSDDYKSEIDKLWGEINALKKMPHNQWKPKNEKRREDGSD